MRILTTIAFGGVSLAALTTAAFAQQTVPQPSGASASEDGNMIVVEARRRDERVQDVPLTVNESTEAIAVRGELALLQTDFGITPLSVAGGAIQVRDEVKLRFDIRAHRMHGT